jgi:hypothetical protein
MFGSDMTKLRAVVTQPEVQKLGCGSAHPVHGQTTIVKRNRPDLADLADLVGVWEGCGVGNRHHSWSNLKVCKVDKHT